MDNLVWLIYFIDVICGDKAWMIFFLNCIIMFAGVGGIMSLVFYGDKDYPEHLKKFPFGKIIGGVLAIHFLLGLIPPKDTAYKMLAAYGVSEVAKNETVQELMGDGMDILRLTLKEYKSELEAKEAT